MKKGTGLLKIFLSLLPAFLLIIHLSDLIDVLNNPGGYPFGSEFFSPFSIYKSRERYIAFQLFSTFFLIITLFLIWKLKWKWVLVILLVDIGLFLYPILTMED